MGRGLAIFSICLEGQLETKARKDTAHFPPGKNRTRDSRPVEKLAGGGITAAAAGLRGSRRETAQRQDERLDERQADCLSPRLPGE